MVQERSRNSLWLHPWCLFDYVPLPSRHFRQGQYHVLVLPCGAHLDLSSVVLSKPIQVDTRQARALIAKRTR